MAKLGKKEAPKVDLDALKASLKGLASHKETLKNSVFVLVGPVKQGKSVCAATISEHFPEELGGDKMTFLEDTLWLGFDRGATDGFAELGLSVPLIDLSVGAEDIYSFQKQLNDALKKARELVKAGIIKNIVVDSVSQFDTMMTYHLFNKHENNDNKMEIWGDVASMHGHLYRGVVNTGARVVAVFHPKAPVDLTPKTATFDDRQKAAAKKVATSLPDDAPLTLAVTGKGGEAWKANGSMILPVVRERKGKKDPTYFLHTQSTQYIQGCSRFLRGLEPKMPAHLGKLIEAIKANQPKL
jgi:hypothetical protein